MGVGELGSGSDDGEGADAGGSAVQKLSVCVEWHLYGLSWTNKMKSGLIIEKLDK
ncbi:hypothetical protein FIU87_01345 [Bacillus sp. THAF10]|nr:hypothetical protein FIU87_01345 [Bacillus sp. THAF10]